MPDLIDLQFARELRRTRGTARPLERGAARNELVRIAPGAYVTAEEWEQAVQAERHRAIASAVRSRARVEPVFSHESAAAFHEIPIIGEWPMSATVTQARGRGDQRSAAVERITRSLAEEDVVTMPDGLRVTSLERTVLDLAARRPTLSAVIAMSAVRHAGVSLERIQHAALRAGRMPGIRAARSVIAQSSGFSESPLETLVLVRCRDLGFAEPEQQRRIRGVDGVLYRVDFAWRDGTIVLEADGKLKYAPSGDRPTPGDVLWAEKRREDALRPRVAAFGRVAWDDAWQAAGLERQLVALGVPRVCMPQRFLTW